VTLAILSATFYILSFPNFNQAWLAWISLVPLSILAHKSSPRQAFLWGWLSGTLAYGGILSWLIVTFQAAHLSIFLAGFCLLILAGYLGLYWGVWAGFLSYCFSRPVRTNQPIASFEQVERSNWMPFYGAAAWVALEYLRTYLFSGFPWVLLADSQVKILPLIQIASLTGTYGVSFLIVWINLALAAWPPKRLAVPLVVVAMTCLYGYLRMKSLSGEPAGRTLRVALLQGNIDQYKKWDKTYVQEIQKTYEELIEKAADAKPDIILWPETSVPGYLLQDPPLRSWLQQTIRKSHSSHLVGAPVMHEDKAYNSSFSLTPEGDLSGEYAKKHLVPFGEIVPWASVLGRFFTVLNELGGFTAGQNSPVLNIAGYPIGVNICYEAIFPNLVRQSVRQGAQVIANLTNDGWYMRTSAPYQHWAPNIFRAVENARWLIRADNTGISGVIDPSGRVIITSPIFQPHLLIGTVVPRQETTPYTRAGDVFSWLCCLIGTIALFA